MLFNGQNALICSRYSGPFCVLFALLTQMHTFSNDLKCCINISCQMTNGCVNMKITYNKTTNASYDSTLRNPKERLG